MLTKEQIFQIMGKYYGNAYYRSAIRLNSSESDLIAITHILDAINSLGYNVSNIHALTNIEDIRLVPIVLDYVNQLEADHYQSELIGVLGFRSYEEFVPRLICLYENTRSPRLRLDISDALFRICSRKYISEYLRIVQKSEYGVSHDFLIDLLCKLRVKETIPILLRLYERSPKDWYWSLLKSAPNTKVPILRNYIAPLLESHDSEVRREARKALRRLGDN